MDTVASIVAVNEHNDEKKKKMHSFGVNSPKCKADVSLFVSVYISRIVLTITVHAYQSHYRNWWDLKLARVIQL